MLLEQESPCAPTNADAICEQPRPTKSAIHPFVADALITGVSQAIVLAANVYLVSLVSRWMGLVALGEYLLLRRVSSWLFTASQLGMSVALPRQIAQATQDTEAWARRYLFASLATLSVVASTTMLLCWPLAGKLAQLCFGAPRVDLLIALALLLLGAALQAMLYGYYRGLQHVAQTNAVQLVGQAAIPLLAFAVLRGTGTASALMLCTGGGLTGASVLWSVALLWNSHNRFDHVRNDATILLRYGVVRVPADVAHGALLALGPLLAAHRSSIADLSYLLLGTTMLTMTNVVLWPIVLTLLARVSRLLATGRLDEVRLYVSHLRAAVSQVSLFIMTQMLIFVGPLLTWWLGASYLSAVPVISICLAGVPGFMYYAALRSVLDAASVKPYNTYNLLLALTVFAALCAVAIWLMPSSRVHLGIASALTIANLVLGQATRRSLHVLHLSLDAPGVSLLPLVVLLGAISIAAQIAFHFAIGLPAFCAVQTLNGLIAWRWLCERRPEWMNFVGRAVLCRI